MEPFAKDTDGFMARRFDRKISGAISRLLIKTPITPNQITLGVTSLGLVAGYYMSLPGNGPKIVGSCLFLLTSILDGCDGEVARARKMTSKLGGWLDFWGDNIVHVAIFYGLAVGLFRDTGHAYYLVLGKAAVIGTLASATLASYQTYMRSESRISNESLFISVSGDWRTMTGSPWRKWLTRWSDALARRDFIYGVVILALISQLKWFLWACAFGSNLYAFILLILFISSPPADS